LRGERQEVVRFREEELSTTLLSESLPIPYRTVDGRDERMLLGRLGAALEACAESSREWRVSRRRRCCRCSSEER
jgi:hypothetical protein